MPTDDRVIPYGRLPDWAIRRYCGITPFSEGIKRDGVVSYGLTSMGYDVRLGLKFKLLTPSKCAKINPKKIDPKAFEDLEFKEGDEVWIPANGYILGESIEYFEIPRDVSCICMGKSTYARCGITINVTPGEPEWCGRWTIEIENAAPVPACVFAGEGIMQVMFDRTAPCDVSYKDKSGKYQGDTGLRVAAVDGGGSK